MFTLIVCVCFFRFWFLAKIPDKINQLIQLMGLWKGKIKINFPHIKVSVEKIEGSRNSFFAAYFIYLFDYPNQHFFVW